MTTEAQLAADYSKLARDNADLAHKYADLYARAVKRESEREAEIDRLSAEIVLLHDAIAELRATVRELRSQLKGDAESSGSYAAQEILTRDKLAALQEAERERRRARTKFLGGVALIIAGIFAGGASTLVWHLVTAEAKHQEAR